jgi:NDP-sugar pyrophosphorylase family protein
MAPVAGRPFIEWVVRYLERQGIERVILSTGYLGEIIEAHFRSHPIAGVKVTWAREVEPLGTAGGFLNAVSVRGETPDTWLVLNGDSLAFADLARASADLAAPGVAGVLLGCPVPDASRYGSLGVAPDGALLGFEEKRPGKGIINAGMYFVRHSTLAQFPALSPLSFEKDVFPEFARRKVLLKVSVVDAPFLDIGTPDSLPLAEDFIVRNRDEFSLDTPDGHPSNGLDRPQAP